MKYNDTYFNSDWHMARVSLLSCSGCAFSI